MPEVENKNLHKALNPPDQQDALTESMRSAEYNFIGAKRLADGTYVGVMRLMFTLAICIGFEEGSLFKRRYCFKDITQCISEYEGITSGEDIPEGWVARRPKPASDDEFCP
jgi:hypothetical protein